jgi:hypothetical protein
MDKVGPITAFLLPGKVVSREYEFKGVGVAGIP